MIEAGAPSTGSLATHRGVVLCPPHRGSHGRTARGPAQPGEGAMRRPRCRMGLPSAAEDSIEAGVLHLASLQRGSLILRESCYNVVTRAPTVGNDSVVPDSKRERGVHARYALLGTRSAGGSRRPGHCVGAVLVGPPLALAARCGPGLAYRRLNPGPPTASEGQDRAHALG
jgi:hypothetical protein